MQENYRAWFFKTIYFVGVSAVFFVFFFDKALSYEKDTDVRVKEISIQDSMKGLIEQNSALKAEKSDLQLVVDRLELSQNVLNNRIKSLTGSADDLKSEMRIQKVEFEKEKKGYEKKIENMIAEKQKLSAENALLNEKLNDKKHYRYWKESQSRLKEANDRLLKLNAEKEKMIAENAKMHYNLGMLFFEKGDYKKSAYEFEYALELLPNDADSYYNLALIYDFYLKESKKAEEHYRKYLDLNRDTDNSLLVKERIADNSLRSRVRE